MNDEQKVQGAIDPSRFENFQKEMDRKLGNTTSELQSLKKSTEQIVAQLAQFNKQSKPKKEDNHNSSDLLYTDPDKWVETQTKVIKDEIRQEFSSTEKQQAKVQQVLSRLGQEYPELNDVNSELSQKAISIFESYPDEDKANTAVSYKAAIMEAASELGVKKASQRQREDGDVDHGDFVVSSGNSRRIKQDKKPKLDARTIEFGALMGLNVEDPKLLKRLADRTKRDFSKYGN